MDINLASIDSQEFKGCVAPVAPVMVTAPSVGPLAKMVRDCWPAVVPMSVLLNDTLSAIVSRIDRNVRGQRNGTDEANLPRAKPSIGPPPGSVFVYRHSGQHP